MHKSAVRPVWENAQRLRMLTDLRRGAAWARRGSTSYPRYCSN